MHNRDITFNWRATMGSPSNTPDDIAAYLDLLSDLCQDDGHYLYRTANRHTCACDDPIVMLHHARISDICCTPADHRLFDKTVSYVRSNKPMYFRDNEIERRMENANGDCPMCGFEISFNSPDEKGRRAVITRCNHFAYTHVSGDTDEVLRQPRTWEGKSWPFAWMQGHKVTAGNNGEKVLALNASAPCQGCLEMEAMEAMELSIFNLIELGAQRRFCREGWGLPVSEYCEDSDDKKLMRVKKIVADAHDYFKGSKEIRLNGAGLKLFISPVRSGMRIREVSFGLRVGGDQVGDYPGFQEFAHKLFEDHGVPTSAT